jgi:hypothetical protein
MTLLAYAISGGGLKFRWIDDVARVRIGEVERGGTMTTIASDCKMGKGRLGIPVLATGDSVERSRMTKEAALSDGAGEVGVCGTFISGSQIIALPATIISDR